MVPLLQTTLGGFSVAIFFSISGFLVYRSACISTDVPSYIAARLLRIFPALAVSVTITSVAMYIIFSNGEEKFQYVRFVFHNSFSFLHQVLYTIPGVLEGRPNTSINGSLWTLQYEFFFYIIALLVSLILSRFRFAVMIVLAILLSEVSSVTASFSVGSFHFDSAATFSKLGNHFLAGMMVYAIYDKLRANVILAVTCTFLCLSISWVAFGPHSFMFVFCFTIILIMLCETPILSTWARFGDPSYGVYIYAFPIQQIAILTMAGFYTSMLISAICSVAIGFASWHLLERRCLKLKNLLARKLRDTSLLIANRRPS